MSHEEWYATNNCTHAHCPHGCSHPQPFLLGGVMFCGKHYHDDGEYIRMVPCSPEACKD
jgi:hypothetical protein